MSGASNLSTVRQSTTRLVVLGNSHQALFMPLQSYMKLVEGHGVQVGCQIVLRELAILEGCLSEVWKAASAVLSK